MADPMCYLNSRRDTHIQSLGMREGDWRERHQGEGKKGGRVLGTATAVSNFITGTLTEANQAF